MRPALFANLEFTTALERATAERKLLLVHATAKWCAPCHVMNRTTWVDPEVVAWLRDRGLAIQVDVDAENGAARTLGITMTPTTIVFVNGNEFDRVVGVKTPKELVAWLKGITQGETRLVALRRGRGEGADIRVRFDFARELVRTGHQREALIEFLWLWEHMLDNNRALYGVRLSFLAQELERLAKSYALAREAIVELRDRAAPRASGPIDLERLSDWICLNGVLGERERTLAWYDAVPAIMRPTLGPQLELYIIPLLVEAERWAEAGALYEDALATIDRLADTLTSAGQLPPEMRGLMRDHFNNEAAQVVRNLSAAGRTQDADQVVRRSLEVAPSGKLARALAAARSQGLASTKRSHN